METSTSQKDKELVAVGASVAAGCIPCTRYHVNAVQAAGATIDEVLRAVEVALGIKRDAAAVMSRVARSALGLEPDTEPIGTAAPADRVSRLVAIAAAVAVNCPTSFQRYVTAGTGAGIGHDEIRLAGGLARMIRAKATEKMDEETKTSAGGAAAGPSSCGCGSTLC